MKAIVLLADWAEAINGKLYIQGGGWSRVAPPVQHLPGMPSGTGIVNCAVALRFLLDWDEANQTYEVGVRLVDTDGQPVAPVPNMGPIEVKAQLEVGRPPGITHGSELDAAMALQFLGLPLQKGHRYMFVLEIDKVPTERATFDVI
jgi:hypothetical protein